MDEAVYVPAAKDSIDERTDERLEESEQARPRLIVFGSARDKLHHRVVLPSLVLVVAATAS